MAYLKERGVGSGIYYPVPLHLQECFAHLGGKPGDLPVSESTIGRICALPVHPMLSQEDLDYVATAVRSCLQARSTPAV